jgi:hypothetical protein
MAVQNIYRHNARSYYDVYLPLTQAYPNKPTWLFKEVSGMFDHQSELMNRIATDILYPLTRESAYAFAAICSDYEPVEANGATTTLTITLTSAKAKTLDIGYQVGGISLATGQIVIYELTAEGNSGGTDTITVAAKQKKTISDKSVFIIDSSDDFVDYPIDGYTNIIRDSMSLVIESGADDDWTSVEYFDNSLSTDQHFQMIYQSSGKVRIRFGDGTTGKKPTLNETAYATFETTSGLSGRVDAGVLTINVGNDPDIFSITNTASVGGNDSEGVNAIIRNARSNVRFKDVVWSQEDLEIAAREYSSEVIKALGFPGVGSAGVHIVPSGGGIAGATLLGNIEDYVKAKTQFGAMPITASTATYVEVDIVATTTIRYGFVEATVLKLVDFALRLATIANDNEVIEYYTDWGIDACRSLVINSLWPSYAFTEDENEALEVVILKWMGLLGTREYRQWGQPLEVGVLWSMGDALYDYGSDIFELVSIDSVAPANITADTDEIINAGTISVTVP